MFVLTERCPGADYVGLKAKNHGNEPSKGAKIDADIQAEEEEMLKKKGAFGPK